MGLNYDSKKEEEAEIDHILSIIKRVVAKTKAEAEKAEKVREAKAKKPIKKNNMARKWKTYKHYPKAAHVEVERSEGLQKTVLDLIIRKVKPITAQEKRLAQQIREIEERGNIVDLPLE